MHDIDPLTKFRRLCCSGMTQPPPPPVLPQVFLHAPASILRRCTSSNLDLGYKVFANIYHIKHVYDVVMVNILFRC